jgi:hypothetical protein
MIIQNYLDALFLVSSGDFTGGNLGRGFGLGLGLQINSYLYDGRVTRHSQSLEIRFASFGVEFELSAAIAIFERDEVKSTPPTRKINGKLNKKGTALIFITGK